ILTEFTNYLNKNENLELLISGHTDNAGSEENNQILSTNRARSVYIFLVENGVSEDKLTYQGFGESKPVYDNFTSEGRSKNRRTEFTIVNK
ncbi:MAG: OmpA family protein, partial [Flavobacteriales bacterium]